MKKFGRTLVTLTVVGVPVPDGMEMRWGYNYSRQLCDGEVLYRTTGVYGRQPVNSRRNFHHWVSVDATVTKSRDAVGQQEAVVRSKSYRGNVRFRAKYLEVIHVVLNYSSLFVNTSYILHAYERKNTGPFLLLQSHLQTPWPVANFNISHYYNLKDHLIHETKVSSAWLNIDTVTHYHFQWFFHIVKIDMNSSIDSLLPWLPGRTNITGTYEMSDDILPQLLVVLDRADGTLELKADMVNTTLNIFTVTFQKPGEEVMHVLTWEMALKSTRASTHTWIWNPHLLQAVSQDAGGRFGHIRLALVEAGNVALSNAQKPAMLMVIPFTDMTVGFLLETYLYPYVRLPVIGSDPGSLYNGDNSPGTLDGTDNEGVNDVGTPPPNIGDMALSVLSKTVGSTLTSVGSVSFRPPWIVRRLMDSLLRPSIQKILAASRVTFTGPLMGKWDSFLSRPRLTYGARYLEGVYGRLTGGTHSGDPSVIAFVINRQYVVTYGYGRTYHIPDDQAADCVHLLAGDFESEQFAVLLSSQGITVVTRDMSITLEFGGNVFRDNCPRPERVPFGRKGSRMRVFMEHEDLVLTTTYGVQVKCGQSHKRELCSIHLSGSHFGHSWGLLGANDGDAGSNFQLVNKYITPVTNTFVQGYAVGGPPKCFSAESLHHTEFGESLHPHPPAQGGIQTRCSTVMAEECIRQFADAKENSTCEKYVPQQEFLDSCLSEASGCGRGGSAACKHIRAYEYSCHLKGAWHMLFVHCDEETIPHNDESGRRPVDIVVVVSEVLESSRSHVETLLHSVHSTIRNVHLGIVGYGGNTQFNDALDPTVSTRYMVPLDKLDVGAANSPWRTAWKRFPNVDTLNKALDMAASYPFRLNTQRVVIVISKEEDRDVTDDVKSTYDNMNIIVNSFGDYETVDASNKVNGINWDSTVIYRDRSSSYRILPLPEGRLVELVVATNGAVFNTDSVTESREKRLKFIVKHMKKQIKLNNVC